jgi:hypothetical protein
VGDVRRIICYGEGVWRRSTVDRGIPSSSFQSLLDAKSFVILTFSFSDSLLFNRFLVVKYIFYFLFKRLSDFWALGFGSSIYVEVNS